MSERTMESLFDLIHRKQAEAILEILENGGVTAQELNAINKFLADNNITGIKSDNAGLKKLSDGLDEFDQYDNVAVFKR
ncbi:hypothetical protein [Amphritea sp. HPY]|uniref:hypothetical protein n=1 Tax=Amphritea sp. HPY TaxID=3421652 RepID=UPI003D7E0D34